MLYVNLNNIYKFIIQAAITIFINFTDKNFEFSVSYRNRIRSAAIKRYMIWFSVDRVIT